MSEHQDNPSSPSRPTSTPSLSSEMLAHLERKLTNQYHLWDKRLRQQPPGPQSYLLLKALGVSKKDLPLTVIDATFGLGHDALVLAHYGLHVMAFEAHPLIAEWGRNNLTHPQNSSFLRDRITLCSGHAQEMSWGDISKQTGRSSWGAPQRLMIDPMYPEESHHKRSAKNSLLMQGLRSILAEHATEGPSINSNNTLESLLNWGTSITSVRRLCIKRPKSLRKQGPPEVAAEHKERVVTQHLFQGKSTDFMALSLQ